jgi:hypothetical protein
MSLRNSGSQLPSKRSLIITQSHPEETQSYAEQCSELTHRVLRLNSGLVNQVRFNGLGVRQGEESSQLELTSVSSLGIHSEAGGAVALVLLVGWSGF